MTLEIQTDNYKYKPSTMPKINVMLFKLEDFNHAMSLDLNMVYYNIPLAEVESNLCTIIIPWEKICYKCIPIGVSNPPEILQHENELFIPRI